MRLSLAAAVAAVWLVGCGTPAPTAGALPMTTIERKDDAAYIGQQQYNALDAGLMVFFDAETAAAQADFFSDAGRERLDRVDWRSQFVVAVFQGWQGASGYGVTIEQVILVGDVVRILAVFGEPEGEAEGGVSSPYHLVALRRPLAPVEGLAFELVVGEEIVLTATPVNP